MPFKKGVGHSPEHKQKLKTAWEERKAREIGLELGCSDLPPLKKKVGRPPFVPAATFDQALLQLSPRESSFVRHVLTGKNGAEAYRLASPGPVAEATARNNSQSMALRRPVKNALELGRQQGALQAVAGIKYDITNMMEELLDAIEFAKETKNATALARCIELRGKAFKLIDSQLPVQAQNVTFVFKDFDKGGNGGAAPLPAIDVEATEVPDATDPS